MDPNKPIAKVDHLSKNSWRIEKQNEKDNLPASIQENKCQTQIPSQLC